MKCACRTCAVRDRESVPSQPLCEPVNDGVICAAGDLSGIGAGEATWGVPISERPPTWPCRFLHAKAQDKGLHIQETAWPGGWALMRYGPSKMDRAATRAAPQSLMNPEAPK
jgi:hypothetical protein